MSDVEIRRFGEFVLIEADSSGFITRDQEKSLLQDGLRNFGLEHDVGGWIVHGVAADQDMSVESGLERYATAVLYTFKDSDNRISKNDFDRAVKIYRVWTRGAFSDEKIRSRLKHIMEERNWQPRRRGIWRSRRWYRNIETKKETSSNGLMTFWTRGNAAAGG